MNEGALLFAPFIFLSSKQGTLETIHHPGIHLNASLFTLFPVNKDAQEKGTMKLIYTKARN